MIVFVQLKQGHSKSIAFECGFKTVAELTDALRSNSAGVEGYRIFWDEQEDKSRRIESRRGYTLTAGSYVTIEEPRHPFFTADGVPA